MTPLARLRVDASLVLSAVVTAVALVVAVGVTRPGGSVGPLSPLTSDAALAQADQRPAVDYDALLAALAGRLASAQEYDALRERTGAPVAPGAVAQTGQAGAAAPSVNSPSEEALVPVGKPAGEAESSAREETILLSFCVLDANSEQCKRGDRISQEPASEDGSRGAAIRVHAGADEGEYEGACRPSADERAFATWLAEETARTLRAKYLNNPAAIAADGFVAYPVPNSKWFHLFNTARYEDGDFVAGKDRRVGDPRSGVFNPERIESFMLAVTDEGATPVGGTYVLPAVYDGAPDDQLPNPTGCIARWHAVTGEGAAAGVDPQAPALASWTSSVWAYGDLDPWGSDYDGTQPHAWFTAYRPLLTVCLDKNSCF